ncbi:MAG: hypothetical protein WAT37_13460 [Saprospiraceae bacterium]
MLGSLNTAICLALSLKAALRIPIGCLHLMHCHASPYRIVQLYFFALPKKVNNPPDHYMIVGQEKSSSAKSLRVPERPRSFAFYLRFKLFTKI